MPFLHIKHENIKIAFFMNAVYSALLFGILFVLDDEITLLLNEKKITGKKRNLYRLLIHFTLISIITFIVTYFFKLLFGWGSIFIGKEI